MAIYHLSVKAISRSSGRTSTAAAAYRAGCEITDDRTGEIHDYTRKKGIQSTDIVLPDNAPVWANNRAKLWNSAELAEKRKDACVAREFEVALPAELSPAERRQLALDFAKEMANREGCAVDVAIHAPSKKGDNRNHHAHILRTTRKVEADGLGAKLDTEKAGRKRSDDLEAVRSRWADMTNEALRRIGLSDCIDHRSFEAQGIDRTPTRHLGVAATGYERRTGKKSEKSNWLAREVTEHHNRLNWLNDLEQQTGKQLSDLAETIKTQEALRSAALKKPVPEQDETKTVQTHGGKTMEYTAKLEADLRANAAKDAADLRARADKLSEQVASGEKSEAVLKTAQEHIKQADRIEKQAAKPLLRPELTKSREQIKLDWQNKLDVLGDEYRQEGIKAARLEYETVADELEPRIKAHNATKKPWLLGIDKWEAERSSLLEAERNRNLLKEHLDRLEQRFERNKKFSFQKEPYNANDKEWCEVYKRAREKCPELWATFQTVEKEEAAERRKAREQKEREEEKQAPVKGRGRGR